jgi:hypothetical protein
MTDNALKPCPMCGGDARVTTHSIVMYGTQCPHCHLRLLSHSATEAEAIAAWNTRPAPTPASDEVERQILDGICIEVFGHKPSNMSASDRQRGCAVIRAALRAMGGKA